MWFHPFDLLSDSDAMFSGLEAVFTHARLLREKGLLDILTMEDYAWHLHRKKYGVRAELKGAIGSPSSRESSYEGAV